MLPLTRHPHLLPTLLLLGLALCGCQTAGHTRVDATSSRLQELRTSVEGLKEQVTKTASSLAAVVEQAEQDPTAAFKQFGKDVKAVDSDYGQARSRLTTAQAEADKLFETWTKNAALISDPDLRAISERRRDELKAELDGVVGRMEAAVQDMESFVATSKDLQIYLSQDLTPKGIRAIAEKSRSQTKAARAIVEALDEVMEAARKAAPLFETAKPPPPPPAS
jgi:predicted  nucleic acid-binding Zn-ribbon protein